MGQQQLILLVLATVIVGLATVVGIRAFSENADRANADALLQDAVRIANDIQASRQKPAPFGGISTFADASFSALGYASTDGTTYENLNGLFTITASGTDVLITGDGGSATTSTTDGNTVTTYENQIQVRVCGLSDTDIVGAIVRVGDQSTGEQAPTCTGAGA
jgi:hypothetical protein